MQTVNTETKLGGINCTLADGTRMRFEHACRIVCARTTEREKRNSADQTRQTDREISGGKTATFRLTHILFVRTLEKVYLNI